MKILHCSDLHLDINATRLGRLNNEVYPNRLKILEHIINTGLELNVDLFAITGDIFNKPKPYPQEYWDLNHILAPVKDKTIMIHGNHDEMTSKGCGLQPMAAMGYKVGLEWTTYDKFFYLAPWGTPLERITPQVGQNISGCVLLLHGGVKSKEYDYVEVEGEIGNYHLSDLQALECKAILLGHHHNQCELAPGIWYAGSPEVFTFGEEHDAKGFLIWDITSSTVKVTQYSTKGLYPEYKTFTPEAFLDCPNKGVEAYVRVKGEVSEYERLDVIKKMREFDCLDYVLDLSSRTKTKRVVELKGRNDSEVLANYFKSKNISNIDELVKLDKEIIDAEPTKDR